MKARIRWRPLHKPAVSRVSDTAHQTMRADSVRRVRRWLWAGLSVRTPRPDTPIEADRWHQNGQLACAELTDVLAELCRTGEVSAPDARAWAADTALHGQRHKKRAIAASLGLSVRGLDGRLARVDEAIGRCLERREPLASAAEPSEQVVAALTAEVAATVSNDAASAAAFRAVAWEQSGRLGRPSGDANGSDRTRRLRTLRRARAAVSRVAQLPTLPRLQPLHPHSGLVMVPYALHDDPAAAVAELGRAWVDRAVDSYPLLIDNGFAKAPTLARAGARTRLRLLEIVANILRDTESLLTLPVTTMWLREATVALGPLDRQALAAARTRAHVLQLHGYLTPAAHTLDRVLRSVPHALYADEFDRRMELIHTALRRASVEVARREAADLASLSRILGRVSDMQESSLHPLLPRLQLHVVALEIAGQRWPTTRTRRRYETWQTVLSKRIATADSSHPLAILDTMITCALRVRQGDKYIHDLLEHHLPHHAEPAWANLFDRMRQRLAEAQARGQIRSGAAAVPAVHHPLRVTGTLPVTSQYRI